MKIVKLEVERVEQSIWGMFWDVQSGAASASPMSPYAAQFDGGLQSWSWPQATVLVRVETASGHSGIGWAEDGVAAASAIVERHLKRFVLGADVSQIPVVWDQMFRASIPYGRKGAAIQAISAIDIALWDVLGKILNKPVYSLMGGPVRQSIPAYASNLHPVSRENFIEEAETYRKQGFRAMKMRMPGTPQDGLAGIAKNVERVEMLREALGYEVDLMVDAYMGWDLPFALKMAKALERFGVRWIEEPLLPDEYDGYAELVRKSGIAIATGEHEFTRFGFRQLIDRRAANILQPDIHRVGGLTELLRVAEMAEAAGLEVIPHTYSAPVVHFAGSRFVCPLLEALTIPSWAKLEIRREPLLVGDPPVVDGRVKISDAPGLGISINTRLLPQLAHWNN